MVFTPGLSAVFSVRGSRHCRNRNHKAHIKEILGIEFHFLRACGAHEQAEIDVLGISGDQPVLVGECRWQAAALTDRDLAELRRRAGALSAPDLAGVTYAFWSRGGANQTLAQHPDVRLFTPDDLLPG